jgi:hypothetical protein
MKKLMPLLLILGAAAGLSACSDADTHGVVVQRGLFGANPVQPAPLALPATTPMAAPARS